MRDDAPALEWGVWRLAAKMRLEGNTRVIPGWTMYPLGNMKWPLHQQTFEQLQGRIDFLKEQQINGDTRFSSPGVGH